MGRCDVPGRPECGDATRLVPARTHVRVWKTASASHCARGVRDVAYLPLLRPEKTPVTPSSPLDPKAVLLAAMVGVTVWFIAMTWRTLVRRGVTASDVKPTPALLGVGFITNFFDTLGIGSFATTTALVRQWRLMRDDLLPGTLNHGHALPVMAQAFIYTRLISVDATTLLSMIIAAAAGAHFGAGIVSRWSKRSIQIGLGGALLAAATLMLLAQLKLMPGGGELLGMRGLRLALGLAGNFAIGALMTVGVGNYAPCLILVSLLGMNPTAAFPIMMGSGAFLQPVGALRFARADRIDWRAACGFTLGGLPAVFLAAFLVKSLPLGAVRWLVIAVVVYTSVTMLRAALSTRATAPVGELEGAS